MMDALKPLLVKGLSDSEKILGKIGLSLVWIAVNKL
jgi:hypothetical protein